MTALKTETQRPEFQSSQPIAKLGKLIDFEILLFQIMQTLEQWPVKVLDNVTMIQRCKQCLAAAQSGDTVSPRVDILDACAAMLLNLNEAASLVTFEKRFPSSELYSAIASAIIELEQQQRMNAPKKVCRDAWDLVLPMFVSSNAGPSNKRGAGNNPGGQGANQQNAQNSPTLVVSSNLWPFLKKLRDAMRKCKFFFFDFVLLSVYLMCHFNCYSHFDYPVPVGTIAQHFERRIEHGIECWIYAFVARQHQQVSIIIEFV